jgi:hypothetical protein
MSSIAQMIGLIRGSRPGRRPIVHWSLEAPAEQVAPDDHPGQGDAAFNCLLYKRLDATLVEYISPQQAALRVPKGG